MNRETIFALLKAHSQEYLSGEAISEKLGISRAAIWKTIDALRRDGYTIEARTGQGYRLTASPDVLTAREVGSFLGAVRAVGREVKCFDTIDSTNSYLKRTAQEGLPDGTVVIANEQTAGRGRMGRTFQSAAGRGVYLSVLLRPQLPPQALLPLTALGAVAMCDAVEKVCAVRPQIKWTNDLVLDGRKLAGILTELSVEGETGLVQYAIMGIGINVNQGEDDFDGEVAQLATSLARKLGHPICRAELAAAMVEALDTLYAALLAGDTGAYLAAYRRDCVTLGRQVQLLWREGRERAFAVDVDEAFGLLVRHADGREEVIRSGEVSVRGLYGYAE